MGSEMTRKRFGGIMSLLPWIPVKRVELQKQDHGERREEQAEGGFLCSTGMNGDHTTN